MNIDGLSESTLEKFIAAGFIHGFADIFRLSDHRDGIVEMDGLGEKSYENLIAATGAVAAKASRARLLNGLGIPGIGSAHARVICRATGWDWGAITDADYDELIGMDGIGDVLAEGYVKWWADERNRRAADDVASLMTFDPAEGSGSTGAGVGGAGVSGGTAGDAATRPPLEGLTFVITGSLETYANRDELKERIMDAGGKATGSVSEKTDYLVNNDIHSASSKNKKAKQLGVKIITEVEVNAMLDGAPAGGAPDSPGAPDASQDGAPAGNIPDTPDTLRDEHTGAASIGTPGA
jgi:DNA ligase (NAD+)